jgi:hypothetical protein
VFGLVCQVKPPARSLTVFRSLRADRNVSRPSLPDGFSALTAGDPPLATITGRRADEPDVSDPVRDPGSLSNDGISIARRIRAGMGGDDGFRQVVEIAGKSFDARENYPREEASSAARCGCARR